MTKSYDNWWELIGTRNFYRALGSFSFAAESVIRELFYKRAVNGRAGIILERRTNNEIENIELEYHKALSKYEEEFHEPFKVCDWYFPYEALEFYDEETEKMYQNHDTIHQVILFLTVNTLSEYVLTYPYLTVAKRFTMFKEVAFLISISYQEIIARLEREDGKLTALEEKARKAGRAKKSPYEKAGTITAVNKLLEEKRKLLNRRGGKSALNRMILDLIANGDIPSPSIPVKETVDTWIDNFKNTQIS